MLLAEKEPVRVLEDYFGYTSFLWKQEEIIRHVLAGKHALVVAPTGIGNPVLSNTGHYQ